MIQLSDQQLLDRLRALRKREHATMLSILLHLAEVERRRLHLLLGYDPTTHVRDRVKQVCVRVPELSATPNPVSGANPTNHACVGSTNADSANRSRVGSGYRAGGEARAMRVEHRVQIQFAARPEFMEKFEEVPSLLSGRFPAGVPFADVFEAGLDAFLDRHSPIRRNARRAARSKERETAKRAVEITAPRTVVARNPAPEARRSRRIPTAVRDAVWESDGGHCTFVGETGERCESTHDLELDHIEAYGRGGTARVVNLRLRCAAHNFLEAERVYGVERMKRFRQRE